MKWFRNKEMLQDILERNKNELEKYKNDKIVALLKDESNLIQDHLILLDENEKLKNEKEQIKEWVKNKIKYLDKGVFLMNYERVKGAIEILNELLKEVLGDD